MSRKITVRTVELVKTLKENKISHQKEFEEAKSAYKETILKRLEVLKRSVEGGELGLKLDITSPVDNTEQYDKDIRMFEMEVNDEIELTVNEFSKYIHDDSIETRNAKMLNSLYLK